MTGEYGVPVPLPAGVRHASHVAYNRYGCRCDDCCAFRSDYDRERWSRLGPNYNAAKRRKRRGEVNP